MTATIARAGTERREQTRRAFHKARESGAARNHRYTFLAPEIVMQRHGDPSAVLAALK